MSSASRGEYSLRLVFSCARVRALQGLRPHEAGLDFDHPYALCVYVHPEPFRDGRQGVLGSSVDGPVGPGDAPASEAGDAKITSRSYGSLVAFNGVLKCFEST